MAKAAASQPGGPGGQVTTGPPVETDENPPPNNYTPPQGGLLYDPKNNPTVGQGDIVHWTGTGQTVQDPNQVGPQQPEQGTQFPSLGEWNYQQQFGGGGMGGFDVGGINYDDYQAVTRDVQDEELASWQLQQMLESDSPYMEQARRAGERAAAQRGALSSSIFAGASQASAIQAAAPIAESDATAFRAAASQNMQAQNQMNLAKLQSETSVLQSSIAASASVASSSIAANANKEIASMRIQSERDAMEFSAAHDRVMQELKQEGRIELFEMDAGLRERLQRMSQDHELTTMDIAHAMTLDQIGYQGSINSYLQNQQIQGGFLGSLAGNIFGSINTISQLGLDDEGFQTALNNIWQTSGSVMNLFNYWITEGQFPEMDFSGGGGADAGPQPPGGG